MSKTPPQVVGSNTNNFIQNWSLDAAFLHIIERLKTTPREGWRKHGILQGESISDHMYRMSVITMLCPPEHKVDKDRCVKLAIVHDMAEALVGDITPPDKIEKGRRHLPGITRKHRRELESMQYIVNKLLKPISEVIAKDIMDLWMEYETGKTPEAVFVKDVDRFELICQTIEYEKKYEAQKDLKEFLHVRESIKNDFVKKWAEDAMKEREAFWKNAGIESIVP
ncbi:putative HD family hydrolase [Tuber indicum]|nr:putative HD family hydrolase [Tuber indicum]